MVYYVSPKTSSLIVKNNLTGRVESKDRSNVVYEFSCSHRRCELLQNEYIGFTRCSLSKWLAYHCNSGAIKDHLEVAHNMRLCRKDLEENTRVI